MNMFFIGTMFFTVSTAVTFIVPPWYNQSDKVIWMLNQNPSEMWGMCKVINCCGQVMFSIVTYLYFINY